MKTKPYLLIAILFYIMALFSCKKNKPANELPPLKLITSFSFKALENNGFLTRDAYGEFRKDTIFVNLPEGTNITQLTPSISFKGKSISPGPTLKQNYTSNVQYTVTGEDGGTTTYTVQIRFLSSAKDITSFIFKASDNPALNSKDVVAIIKNDTINIFPPVGISLASLVPTIVFSGQSISPASNAPVNLVDPVYYVVTAQDGSTKTYTAICFINLAVYFGGADGNLYALNATTGGEIWKRQLGSIAYTPTVDGDKVFAVTEEGYLNALDAKSGNILWKFWVGKYHCIPMVENGVVYEMGDGNMYGVDCISGLMVSKKYAPGVNPTIANNKIYLPRSLYGGMSVFNTTTGVNVWGFGGSDICVSNPAVANGTVYLGNESSTMAALDANSGALKWRVVRDNDNGGSGGAPTFDNGLVYIVSYDKRLFCFDANDGSIKWQKSFSNTSSLSSPVAYKNMVYLGGNGRMYAIDGPTGNQKWIFDGSSSPYNFTSCTYANGIVYVGRGDGEMYALDAVSGALKWQQKAGAGITTNVCVIDGSGTAFHPGDSGDQN